MECVMWNAGSYGPVLMGFITIDKQYNWDIHKNNKFSIYSTGDYFNGLIYPTPFLSGDARSTRALLFFLIVGILIIIINFDKNIKLTSNNKTLFLFIFFASILVFKTALSRSDTPHIKVAAGFKFILIYSIVLYFLLHFN